MAADCRWDQRRPGAFAAGGVPAHGKGSFFYDQQLGSRLYTLKGSYGNREALSETAMQMVREALKPMAEVTPLGVRAGMTGPDQLSLTVSLLADRKQMELEVLI